jgi:hypothetical protein
MLAMNDSRAIWEAMVAALPLQYPVSLSGHGIFDPCPASMGTSAPCANSIQSINVNATTFIYANYTRITFDSSVPLSDTNQPQFVHMDIYRPLINIAEMLIAAVRIDLGNPSPNNFLLHRSALNATLYSIFPASSLMNASMTSLYDAIIHPELYNMGGMLPLTMAGTANIQTLFLCHLQQLKASGPLVISVMVATLSILITVWALIIKAASFLIASPGALMTFECSNACLTHIGCRVSVTALYRLPCWNIDQAVMRACTMPFSFW